MAFRHSLPACDATGLCGIIPSLLTKCDDMQAWDWGGVALYSMLSVLNALWFGRICSMVAKGLKRKQKADSPSTPVGDTDFVRPLDTVKQPVKVSPRPAKGTTAGASLRQRTEGSKSQAHQ